MSSYEEFNGGAASQARDWVKGLGNSITKGNSSASVLPTGLEALGEYRDVIRTGNKNFQNITEDFQKQMEKTIKESNDYLVRAETARSEIEKCMTQDIEAKAAALREYDRVISEEKSNYVTQVYVPSSNGYRDEYDEESHKAAAKAAAQKVWEENRCELW